MADELIEGMNAGSEVEPGQLTLFDDLNAVRMHMYNSLLGPKSYIAQRSRDVFERPTYLIQSLNQNWMPKGDYHALIDHNLLVEFYALDYISAQRVAGDLLLLFGRPGTGLVLPYWDLSDPADPLVLYDDYWTDCGFEPNTIPRMGLRVLQDSLVVNSEQEDSDVVDEQQWQVTMSFRAHAPRILFDVNDPAQAGLPIREVKLSGFLTDSSAGFVSG